MRVAALVAVGGRALAQSGVAGAAKAGGGALPPRVEGEILLGTALRTSCQRIVERVAVWRACLQLGPGAELLAYALGRLAVPAGGVYGCGSGP